MTYPTWEKIYGNKTILNGLVKDNEFIKAAGESNLYNVAPFRHVDVLIVVGTETGTAGIQFFVDVVEIASNTTIRTYNGTDLSAAGVDHITIDNLTLGTHIKIRWTAGSATLDASNWFDACYVRVVAKE